MTPDRHERLSPSTSNRWLCCPYSAQNDLPRFTNAAAEKGTALHSLAAEVLAGRADLNEVKAGKDQDAIEMYADHVHSNGGEILVEHFWESMAIDEFGGTSDCTILKDNKVAVYDFKTGKWPVDAYENTQLLCYASIVLEHFDVSEFFGVIVQPNVTRGLKIKVAEYSLDQVDEHRERVKVAAMSSYKQAGDHCLFCPLRRANKCEEGAAHGQSKGWKYGG